MNFLKTAFNSKLSTVAISEADRTKLEVAGLKQATLQRYVIWRRATLFFVVIGTLVSAGVTTYEYMTDDEDEADVIELATTGFLNKLKETVPAAAEFVKVAMPDEEDEEEEPPTRIVGKIVDGAHTASVYALPLAALIALGLGNRLRASYIVLLLGFLFSFFMPILVALCPWSWWGYPEPVLNPGSDPGKYILNELQGVIEALATIAALLPAVLSLVPGIVKGCLRVKSLLPKALLPGWLIVIAGPLYGMFILAIVVGLAQFDTPPYILIGLALVCLSSLVYASRPSAFTRPLIAAEDYRRLKTMQLAITVLMATGGLVMLGFLLTREVMGVHLIGTDPKTSLMRPIDVFQFVVETLSRGMFVAALSADLFLRANLNSWRHQRALGDSPEAAEYDEAMKAMDGAIEGKGV